MLHSSQLAHPDDCGLIAPVHPQLTSFAINNVCQAAANLYMLSKGCLAQELQRSQQFEQAVMWVAANKAYGLQQKQCSACARAPWWYLQSFDIACVLGQLASDASRQAQTALQPEDAR